MNQARIIQFPHRWNVAPAKRRPFVWKGRWQRDERGRLVQTEGPSCAWNPAYTAKDYVGTRTGGIA